MNPIIKKHPYYRQGFKAGSGLTLPQSFQLVRQTGTFKQRLQIALFLVFGWRWK